MSAPERGFLLLPKVIMILLQGVKEALVRVRIYLPESAHQILHFSPPGIAVGGTGRLDDRKIQHFCHMFYMAFRKVYQGPDHGDTGSAHGGFRVKSMETAFIKDGHQEQFFELLFCDSEA